MRLQRSQWWLLLFGRFTGNRCFNSWLSPLSNFVLCCFFCLLVGFGVCSCRKREAFFTAPPQDERVPQRGIDVLCDYLRGVCRLFADILCPLRLLWLLCPVHWGSALPIPGGHLVVLCRHGIILWLWAWSIDPNWSPRWDLLRSQRSGLRGHGLLVSDAEFSNLVFFSLRKVSLVDWLLPVNIPVSDISSMWSMAWHRFSSSMASCCWLRVSTPRAPSSRPLVNSGAPSVAAASVLRWEHGEGRRRRRAAGVKRED